jgi:uncharacterized protein YcnI
MFRISAETSFAIARASLNALVLALAVTASSEAHVVVFPADLTQSAPACGYTTFTVRVPVEKPIATTGIRILVPDDVTVVALQPKASWQTNTETTKGRISAIAWTGGKLMPHEFEEFSFLAAAPKRPEVVAWDAEQTYEDGSVVRWTGAPGSETPHSQTTFTESAKPCRGAAPQKGSPK